MSKSKSDTPVKTSAKPSTDNSNKNDAPIATNDVGVLANDTNDTDMSKVDLAKTDMFKVEFETIEVKDMNGYTVPYPGVSNVKQTTDKEGAWLEFDSLQDGQDGQVRHMRVLNGKMNS